MYLGILFCVSILLLVSVFWDALPPFAPAIGISQSCEEII